jgi:hypothetical protein
MSFIRLTADGDFWFDCFHFDWLITLLHFSLCAATLSKIMFKKLRVYPLNHRQKFRHLHHQTVRLGHTKNSRDMGMWQIHALSTVLNTPIKSVYPIGRGHNVRPHLNRLVLPRDESTAPPAIIMWTSTHGAAAAPHAWIPNHFVVCFPPQWSCWVQQTMSHWTRMGHFENL